MTNLAKDAADALIVLASYCDRGIKPTIEEYHKVYDIARRLATPPRDDGRAETEAALMALVEQCALSATEYGHHRELFGRDTPEARGARERRNTAVANLREAIAAALRPTPAANMESDNERG